MNSARSRVRIKVRGRVKIRVRVKWIGLLKITLRELQLLSCNIRLFQGHRLVAGNIAVSGDFVIDAGVNSALTLTPTIVLTLCTTL